MKSSKFVVIAIIAVASGIFTFARINENSPISATRTETRKVQGKCEMCKARIEKAAKIEGVTRADWNINTGMLALAYNPAVVTGDQIQRRIAAAGHDTEKYKATDAVYNNLPGCCLYR
jgi:copper chaperone CopZ